MQENKRIEWIDAVRGIVIIMVLLNHSATSAIRDHSFTVDIQYLFTVTAAMPIMMFISGCSMSISKNRYMQYSLREFISKKFKSLLVPYICYAVMIYIIFEICSFIPIIGDMMDGIGYGGMHPITFFIGLLIGNNEFSIHVWFLYVLFFYEILTFLVFKYLKSNTALYILAIVFHFLIYFINVSFSLSFENGLAYLIFFAGGIYFADRKIKKQYGIVSGFMWIILFIAYLFFIMRNTLVFEIVILLIPFFAIITTTYIGQISKGKVYKTLNFFGKYSMSLYLFQQPFFGSALGTVLYLVLRVPAWPSVFICLFMSITMPLLIRKLFVKYKWFQFMFGIK